MVTFASLFLFWYSSDISDLGGVFVAEIAHKAKGLNTL